MTTCSDDNWHIFYKDITDDDPMWHLYDDYMNATVFRTKDAALEYLNKNADEFDGCIVSICKDRASV